MYDRIMVPLDGSELAEVPLWYAARLTGRLKSTLTLVYVSSPDERKSQHMLKCYLDDTAARMRKEAKEASKDGSEITVDCQVLTGDPAEEIIDYADKAKTDLIILSSQGKSGIRRWALGNVANKVIQATRKQVLLVRATGTEPEVYRDRLEKVLVPVDGSRESESILRYIGYLTDALGLEMVLLHVWARQYESYPTVDVVKKAEKMRKQEKDYVERLAKRLQGKGLRASSLFSEVWLGEEAEEIIRVAEDGKFSMVAMSTHGRSGVGRWIYGSNAHKVLNEGSTPLLLARPSLRKKKPAQNNGG